MQVESMFHTTTGTWTHIISSNTVAIMIDPVLDYDARSGHTSTAFIDEVLTYLEVNGMRLEWILETHAHADHLSAAVYVKQKTNAYLAMGAGIRQVQKHFATVFNIELERDVFDRLLEDGDCLPWAQTTIEVMATPGHTPDSVSYKIGNAVFIGDTLFAPDVGTARCDFPGGNAKTLYDSLQRLLSLPEQTLLYLCHDYPADGREPRAVVSVAEQRKENLHLGNQPSCDEFVRMRTTKDASLNAPALLWPSLFFNIRGGLTPEPENNGISYLKIPLNQFRP